MAEYVLAEKEDLTVIADAVRATTGSTETFNLSELSVAAAQAISNGTGGGR